MTTTDLEQKKTDAVYVEDVSSDNTAQIYDQAEVEPKLNLQTVLAFLALTSQFNAYILTLLIPSTILSYINADLGPDPSYTWITVSWQLCASIIISVSGRLSDIFGRRYFILFGSGLSFIGTIVGATGQSINQMIVSGVIFGTGSGFQEMAYACIQEIVPNKWRIYAIGLFDLSASISFMGPLVAYAFIDKTTIGWRGAYWYMCGFHGFFFIVLACTYFPPTFHTKHKDDGKTKLQLLKELDYVGLFLFSSGCLLFLLGVNYGGRQYPWNNPHVIGPMVVGVCCLVALGFWEVYADLKYPLMPPRLFKRWRRFSMVLVVCFVGGMLYYSMNVLWPRQSGLLFTGPDPITRGLYAEAIPLGTIISSFVVIFICARVGHERWQLVIFMICETALIGSLASVGLDDKVQAIITIVCLSSTVTPPQLLSFTMLSLGIDDQVDIGIAVGLAGTFRLMGGAIATAIYTAIVNNGFAEHLPGEVLSAVSGLDFPSSNMAALLKAAAVNTAAAYKTVPGISTTVIAATQLAVKKAYVSAFSTTYLAAIAFGCLATVAAFFTRDIDPKMKSSSKAVMLENEKKKSEEEVKVDRV
ncbi:hypothetical protein H2201_000141 [Coniosporium apollinis]|uniref:Major facilitator superfamily (MFS) profile domain-containing protein n=1 Tax=Coniosporium apollinis TaxID=61459 RepID=A0ABQ9P920_9PEZI|nr:hypothetical protein H2201_000141 [Coniosporium apollinis]